MTFYSYKGGVGRTCALANCAMQLAISGRKVLAVDFDLEAPGLVKLFNGLEKHKGVVEYLVALRQFQFDRKKHEGDKSDESALPPPSDPKLDDNYLMRIASPQGIEYKKGGCLDIFCAGYEDASYPDRVEALGIRALYNKGVGAEFFKQFKEKIRALGYNYVLMDSRTGFSDLGIVCTNDLADAFIFICGLNKQNIMGTRAMIETLRHNEKSERQFILVASPVPDGEEYMKIERLREFSQNLGRNPDVILPYHPHLAFSEELFITKFPSSGLAEQYKKLTLGLQFLAGDIFERWTEEARKARFEKDLSTELTCLRMAAEVDPADTIEILVTILSNIGLSGIGELAEEYFNLAVDISAGKNDRIYFYYGTHLLEKARSSRDVGLIEKGAEKLQKAIAIKNDEPEYFNNYGYALVGLGKMKKDIETIGKGIENLVRAIEFNKNMPHYISNIGYAYFELGKLQKDQALLDIAKGFLMKAEDMKEGYGAYNLACIEAMQGNFEKATEWLKISIDHFVFNKITAREDEDLKSLWNDPEFKRITRDE